MGNYFARYGSIAMNEIWSSYHKYWVLAWSKIAYQHGNANLGKKLFDISQERDVMLYISHMTRTLETKTGHELFSAMNVIRNYVGEDIHSGLTSSDVQDLAFTMQLQEATDIIVYHTTFLVRHLISLASKYKSLPAVGYTHYQPASAITLGYRFAGWAEPLLVLLNDIHRHTFYTKIPRGSVGTSGELLWSKRIDDPVEYTKSFIDTDNSKSLHIKPSLIVFQTSHRVEHMRFMNILNCLSAHLAKIANDIRILHALGAGIGEYIPKEGSSAMPHKVNPSLCERVDSLSILVSSYASGMPRMVSTQGLERTLNDSAYLRDFGTAFSYIEEQLKLLTQVTSSEKLVDVPSVVKTYSSLSHLLYTSYELANMGENARESLRLGTQYSSSQEKAMIMACVSYIDTLISASDL